MGEPASNNAGFFVSGHLQQNQTNALVLKFPFGLCGNSPQMQNFLRALWSDLSLEGEITVQFLPSKCCLHLPVASIPDLDDDDLEYFSSFEENTYYTVAALRPGLGEYQKGKVQDVFWLPAVWLDLDFFHDQAHVAKNLPASLEEAAEVLLKNELDPSAVVSSGHGAHLYWFFDEPLRLPNVSRRRQIEIAFGEFQKRFKEKAEAVGWHIDKTTPLNQHLRLPGFVNRKKGGDFKKVEVLYLDPKVRYAPDAIFGRPLPKMRDPNQVFDEPIEIDLTYEAKSPEKTKEIHDKTFELLKNYSRKDWKEAVQNLLIGKPIAEIERDNVMNGLANVIIGVLWENDPESIHIDPEVLAELFLPSARAWAARPDATKTVEQEMTKAADKFRRGQIDFLTKQEKLRRSLEPLAKALIPPSIREKMWPTESGDTPLIESAAETPPEVEKKTFSELKHHVIICDEPDYYVWDFRTESYYGRPMKSSVIPAFVRDAWHRDVAPFGINAMTMDKKTSELKPKPADALIQQYGTLAKKVQGDLTLKESWFDPDQHVFHRAMCVMRDLPAEFDPDIDAFLHAFASDDYDALCDWLAGFPQLDKPLPGLVVTGGPGKFKTGLALALARLWRKSGPASLANIIKGFNEDIVNCPLILLDEGLPKNAENCSALLRSMTGQTSFICDGKNKNVFPVNGCVRLIIAANNPSVLNFSNENLTAHDLEAIRGRWLHIKVSDRAQAWLQHNNLDRRLTTRWIEGDGFAKHVLYLAQTRKLKSTSRFLVEGNSTEFHNDLIMQNEIDNAIFEWVVRFCTNPDALETKQKGRHEDPFARICEDSIFVNAQAMANIHLWETYMDERRQPTVRQIGRALEKISRENRRIRFENSRPRFHVLDLELVFRWCERYQVGDLDKIKENLKIEDARFKTNSANWDIESWRQERKSS